MSRSRVAQPETQKLDLSDGDWLLVKKRLSHGERTLARQHMYRDADGERRLDSLLVSITMVAVYLVDWSLVDPQGHQIPIQGQSFDALVAALNSIYDDDFDEVSDAVDAHVMKMRAERDAQKKILSGEAIDSKSSTSLAAVAGGRSG